MHGRRRRVIRGWVAALVVVAAARGDGRKRRGRRHQEPRPAGMADVHRLGRARRPGGVHDRLRTGGRLHRGSPPRLGRQAGRRPRVLSADGPRARREDDLAFDGQRDRERRDAHVRRRRGHHVSEEHGRQAAVHGRPRGVCRLRPRRARARATSIFAARTCKGAAVVWLGTNGPKNIDPGVFRRVLSGRNRYATEQLGAAASIGPLPSAAGLEGRRGRRGGRGRRAGRAGAGGPGGGRGAPLPTPDFTTVQRLDTPAPPNVSANDAFFAFLFSQAPVKYDELKRQASAQERTAVVSRAGRDDHVQRGRGLSDRPHAAHQERRRRRRGQRSAIEEHLRRVRRALRSRRLRRGRGDARRHRRAARRRARPGDRRAPRTIASGTAPTTTGRGPWRSWRWRRRSPRGRSRGAR